MKIALIGYGKMGKAIEEIAVQKGHEIVLKINSTNTDDLITANLQKADVAIEFTSPHTAVQNIKKCLDANLPVVSGSTGWLEKRNEITQYCEDKNGAFLYASNFSIGVNLFFEINQFLAKLMASYPDYDVMIKEIHHTQKKDAPSGTAITLAEQILQFSKTKTNWKNEVSEPGEALQIVSERTDPAAGTHIVTYSSLIDDIEISHTAHNRKGFAAGAILAAKFLRDKKGIFTMKDVLSL